MARTALRKAGYLLLILLGVSLLSFALLQLSGRDPALAIALRSQGTSEENLARLREEMGLNGTMLEQYLKWLTGFLRGDFGYSIYSGRAVAADLLSVLPVTCALMGLAFLWILLLGTPMALYAAYRPGKLFDQVVRILNVLGICLPTFWSGYLLLVLFAVKIPLISVAPKPGLAGLLLPSFALAVPSMASYTRVFRASLLKQMHAEYCLIARTRGLSRKEILLRHAVRNAMPPVVTLLMQYVGYLFIGTVLVESVFSLNGLGSYLLGCALASDAAALAACLVLAAAVYAVFNLLGEFINRMLCPWMEKGGVLQ